MNGRMCYGGGGGGDKYATGTKALPTTFAYKIGTCFKNINLLQFKQACMLAYL